MDRFLGELARRGYSPRTRDDYFRKLCLLCDGLDDEADVRDVTPDECRDFLDRWISHKPGTRYHSWAVLSSFFRWLYQTGAIETNPMARIEAPKRLRYDEVEVTTVSGSDVRLLFDACETWQELLCLSTLAYLGPRRRAASDLRLHDLDLDRGTIRFREKGGKVIVKPVPVEYEQLLRQGIAAAAIEDTPDAYVIPMARIQSRTGARDDRVIWRTVKRIGRRVGVDVHPHSLRAAFAVHFLETHPGELEALQRLMGHSKIETTQIYLRRLDRERQMERVRDLSWGTRFGDFPAKAPGGFEPPYEALQASA
jgi:site-specific recombinase XerD